MLPIVHGLEEDFSEGVAFRYLDAADGGAGQTAYTELGLRGHPAILIFDASGGEVYRDFGIVEADQLAEQLRAVAGD
jgi:hypothetical protein